MKYLLLILALLTTSVFAAKPIKEPAPVPTEAFMGAPIQDIEGNDLGHEINFNQSTEDYRIIYKDGVFFNTKLDQARTFADSNCTVPMVQAMDILNDQGVFTVFKGDTVLAVSMEGDLLAVIKDSQPVAMDEFQYALYDDGCKQQNAYNTYYMLTPYYGESLPYITDGNDLILNGIYLK